MTLIVIYRFTSTVCKYEKLFGKFHKFFLILNIILSHSVLYYVNSDFAKYKYFLVGKIAGRKRPALVDPVHKVRWGGKKSVWSTAWADRPIEASG